MLSEDPDNLQMRLVIYSLLAGEGSPQSQEVTDTISGRYVPLYISLLFCFVNFVIRHLFTPWNSFQMRRRLTP